MELAAEIQGLLNRVREHLPRIEAHVAGAELYGAPRLSIFQLLAPNENALSRVLAELLDPRGSHGQGELFLNEFLRQAKLPLVSPAEARHVRVRREFTTHKQRRIDIVVETPNAVLGIENKPWAAQQEKQLFDYDPCIRDWIAEGRRCALMFISDQEPKERVQSLIQISYRQDIARSNTLRQLIENTMPLIKSERTRSPLEDFLGFLQIQFGGGSVAIETDAPYVEAIRREFEANSGNRKAVAALMLSRHRLYYDLLATIGDFIKSEIQTRAAPDIEVCRVNAFEAVETADVKLTLDEKWKIWGLRRRSWPANCAVALDSDRGKQGGVYFGVYAPNPFAYDVNYPACPARPQLEVISQKLTGGKNSSSWPWYKWADTPTCDEAFVARLVLETAEGDIKAHPEICQLADRIVSLVSAVDEALGPTASNV